MKPLYQSVLKKFTPAQRELALEKALVEKIREKIENIEGKHSHIEWCGSSARGTHLRGDRDIDLFVMFDQKISDTELEKEGLRIGKAVFRGKKWKKAYSQHPYIRGTLEGFDVEIVPSYIVEHGHLKKSAVDRTPFHNRWLLQRLNEKKQKEIRLLKQFMKGINAYGADLKNNALPGYGIELLVTTYGTFENAIKQIASWKPGKIISFGADEKIAKENFKGAPLILIDPVDENRNVASALSLEQFERMILAAKLFLKKPSAKFFFGAKTEKWPKEKVEKMLKKTEIISIKGKFPATILPDLIWGQLARYEKKVSTHLKEKDFSIIRSAHWSDEKDVFFLFELEALELQKAKKITGPFASDSENAKRFLEKKRKILSGPRVENGRLVLEIERKEEETSAKKILEKFLKKSKCEEKSGIRICIKSAKVLAEKDLLREYKGKFAEYFTLYLGGKEVFE
ncbi:MAG: CCA tRNA nucleotidyltransferase [Candidatus Diapherotrites archaeon]|nr:CCA tRNA nucleotidyltransferase [Candidatus Diapherotrites archaeon]